MLNVYISFALKIYLILVVPLAAVYVNKDVVIFENILPYMDSALLFAEHSIAGEIPRTEVSAYIL